MPLINLKLPDLLQFVLNSIPDFVAYVDRNLIYRFCNRPYMLLSGLDCEEIIGCHAEKILGTHALEKIRPYLDQVLSGERVHYQEWVKYKGKDKRYVDVIYEPHIIEGEVLGFAVLVRNVTTRKRAEDQLIHQANHDPLTGLPNRTFFLASAERLLARAKQSAARAAFLFLDLDGFKHINDDFGHDIGDEVLKVVASRFSNVIRKTESIARVGGDEFVVQSEGFAEVCSLSALAERLIHVLDDPIGVASRPCKVGVSIGISFFPEHGQDVTSLLCHADEAMYLAKQRGRNLFQFYKPAF